MKYVVVNSDKYGQQLFICPREVDHDRFAEVLCNIRFGYERNWERHYLEPVAAGFTDGVKCWGHSETLSLGSRGEVDAALLARSAPPSDKPVPPQPITRPEPTPWHTGVSPARPGAKLTVEQRLAQKAQQRNQRKP